MPSLDDWIESASDADLDRALERVECALPKHTLRPSKADEAAAQLEIEADL